MRGAALGLALAAMLAAGAASADVRRDGAWDGDDPRVSLELSGVTRGAALKALAKEAGWSLVLKDTPDDEIDVFVKDQPASKVLEIILSDGSWVAKRDGTLVSIGPLTADAAPTAAPAAPPPPPSPPDDAKKHDGKQRDVEVFGNNIKIGKDDVVHDVTVMGGRVEIEGRVTGDLAVVGGTAQLRSTARVEGDASVTGGRIEFDEGARVEGDLSVLGGSVSGSERANIGGSVKLDPSDGEHRGSFVERAGWKISEAIRSAAFFFVVGAIVIALGGVRAETLRAELAARPMRSAAVGLFGIVASAVAIAIAAVTVLGIPLAIIGAIALVVAIFAGLTSAITVLGAAVTKHKTSNVYLHLAAGCVLFLVAGLIPVIGGLVQAGVVLAGMGAVVSTRAGGLLAKKFPPSSGSPYR